MTRKHPAAGHLGGSTNTRFFIRDHDDKFGGRFDTVAEATGIKIDLTKPILDTHALYWLAETGADDG